jgi:hypothetical protein
VIVIEDDRDPLRRRELKDRTTKVQAVRVRIVDERGPRSNALPNRAPPDPGDGETCQGRPEPGARLANTAEEVDLSHRTLERVLHELLGFGLADDERGRPV